VFTFQINITPCDARQHETVRKRRRVEGRPDVNMCVLNAFEEVFHVLRVFNSGSGWTARVPRLVFRFGLDGASIKSGRLLHGVERMHITTGWRSKNANKSRACAKHSSSRLAIFYP
jgi:hypothetical protein